MSQSTCGTGKRRVGLASETLSVSADQLYPFNSGWQAYRNLNAKADVNACFARRRLNLPRAVEIADHVVVGDPQRAQAHAGRFLEGEKRRG